MKLFQLQMDHAARPSALFDLRGRATPPFFPPPLLAPVVSSISFRLMRAPPSSSQRVLSRECIEGSSMISWRRLAAAPMISQRASRSSPRRALNWSRQMPMIQTAP